MMTNNFLSIHFNLFSNILWCIKNIVQATHDYIYPQRSNHKKFLVLCSIYLYFRYIFLFKLEEWQSEPTQNVFNHFLSER